MTHAHIPLGAEQRLLPEWIPLSFFGLALLCLPLAWAGITFKADDLTSFQGGIGPVLSIIHSFSLGVLATTAFGGAMQMLPVATGVTMNAPARVVALLCLWSVGIFITLSSFAFSLIETSALGTGLLFMGAILFISLLLRLLLNAQSMHLVRRHAVFSAISLLLAASLGFMSVLSWANWISLDLSSLGILHAGFTIYGFMGLIVFGFSRIMVPMLAIADLKTDRLALFALALVALGLSLWAIGSLFSSPLILIFAILIGLGAAGLHIREMLSILKARLRSRLGPEWHLIRFSWAMLPLSLLFGLLSLLFENFETAAHSAIFLGIIGWLVSFVLGILQRIIPFLLSMQIARRTGMPELPSKLAHAPLLKAVAPLHIIGVLSCASAIALDSTPLLIIGSLFGFLSACLFLAFFLIALLRKAKCLAQIPVIPS